METEMELRNKIRPVLEEMIFQLVIDKPDNVVKSFSKLGFVYDNLASKARKLYLEW